MTRPHDLLLRCVPVILCLAAAGCGESAPQDAPSPATGAPPASSPAVDRPADAGSVSSASAPSESAPSQSASSDPDSPPSTAPAPPGDSTARALKLIDEMREAYESAPVMINRATISRTVQGTGTSPIQTVLRLGTGMDMDYDTPFFRMACVDGTLYLKYSDEADRYLRIEGVTDLYQTINDSLGSYGATTAQLHLRHRRPLEELLAAFAYGLGEAARLSGYRVIEDDAGRSFEQISLITATASATVNVDPETKLIAAIETVQKPDSPIPNFTIRSRLEFKTQVFPALPDPIVFETGDAMATESVNVLRGVAGPEMLSRLKLVVGEPAPPIKSFTIRGQRFELGDSAGKVLLLVFWAAWDIPSRKGLPQLSRIVDWAAEQGIPLDVYGVCGMRRRLSPNGYWEQALTYWEREQPKFETLIDRDDVVFDDYGVLGVPMTVVIDADGRFVNALANFDEQTLDTIAAMIQSAVEAVEKRRTE